MLSVYRFYTWSLICHFDLQFVHRLLNMCNFDQIGSHGVIFSKYLQVRRLRAEVRPLGPILPQSMPGSIRR